jgi:hypothetical protein
LRSLFAQGIETELLSHTLISLDEIQLYTYGQQIKADLKELWQTEVALYRMVL